MNRATLILLTVLLGLFLPREKAEAQAVPAKSNTVVLVSRTVKGPADTYTSQKTILQFLDDANTKRGNGTQPVWMDMPTRLEILIGAPIDAVGVGRIHLKGNNIPPNFLENRKPIRRVITPGQNKAGAAVVLTGLQYAGGRIFANIHEWSGSIFVGNPIYPGGPLADGGTRPPSGGRSGDDWDPVKKRFRGEIAISRRYAIEKPVAANLTNIDVTDLEFAISSTSQDAAGSTIPGNDGMSSIKIAFTWADPPANGDPAPVAPTGSLALSKPVQRSGTTILVTPSAQLFNTLSVQRRTGVAPPYSPGQNIGPTKPSFGTEVATVNGTGVAQTADVPDAVVYYALFALGGDNNWYFLDSKTLTPYGYVAGFDVLSLDTMSTMALTGLSRRTRADKTYRIELDTVGGSQILTRLPRDPAHDAADHEMELWATGFSAPNTALANQGFQPGGPVFNAAPPGSILKGRHNFLLGQPAISLGGLQRPPETPYALDIVPWSRPVRSATGWVPGVQLSSPVRLTVYPVAGFELVSGIIDLRRGVCRNRGTQGQDIALPGPDVELDVSVTMRVLRPYPHSRVILVAQDPNGALLKVAEVDNRMSPSDAPFEMSFGTVTPFFDTTGNYTFYLMAETPVDQATLGGAGLPGYSEPTTPGYGWVKIGTVTFFYDAVIEYHDVTSVEGGQNLVPQ
jgi:hypothetical protein